MLELTAASHLSAFERLASMPLRAYQRAELARMDEMEAGEYEPRAGTRIRTSFGILGSKVGAGKTVTVCALIKHTLGIEPRARLPCDTTFGTSAITVRRAIEYPSSMQVSRCSLIVVPHGLQYQWESELEAAGIDFCRHNAFCADAAACLVPATKLASFHAEHGHVHFKRLVIDEADTVVIRCQPDVRASFTWFVSATYHNMDACWRTTAAKPIYCRCFRFFAAASLELSDIAVRSQSAWVEACNALPAVESQTVICAAPGYMNVVHGVSSASISEMLAAGDAEGAIVAMGGDAHNESNIVDVVTARIEQDLARLEARAAYFEQIGSAQAAAQARDAIRSKQQQLASIQERLAKFKEGMCAICLSDLASTGSHVLTSCCSHLFCGPCIMTWRCRVDTCPMCRAQGYTCTLIKDGAAAAGERERERPKTKEEALIDVISSARPGGKFIVFSNYDRTFDTIGALLLRHGISSRVLKGTPAAFRKILADHEAGRVKVLLMNSRFDGAGHSMQWVTDAVTYHRLRPETLAQVTGRGMRPGRTVPLAMHHLRWPCEV
ncbi:hypothetical protein COO60DRAFT_1643790 [Scenedesmus sp. NREL 46B-D3]|nr:hypothetical protein COO60DRAFT_1643790 [Scenedesmus sp. NREL 46B-D3]